MLEQRVHQERRTAGGDEVVDVGRAVGVDPGEQRHRGGQVGQVVPRERDAGRGGDRDEVHRVVGRAAGGQQGDAGVDDRLLVDEVSDGRGLPACGGDGDGPLPRGARQGLTQGRAGVGERRVRQVQPHHLHQHLVAVGGAVERAGAGRVVRRRLRLEQLLAADLALGVELAHPRLLPVGQSRRHRSGRDEDGRQVTERERADEQAGHDLVADAEHHRGVEHVVRQGDRGRHRDQVTAEQRQLHAGAALGDPVAHRGHTAGELGQPSRADDRLLQHLGHVAERLVRREHVVVGRHDRDVGLAPRLQAVLHGPLGGGEAVGEVGAGQPAPGGPGARGGGDTLEVRRPGRGAAAGDAVGDVGHDGMDGVDGVDGAHAVSCQDRPSRSMSVVAAAGPSVPAG